MGDQQVLTFGDHLNELKRRSFFVFANFIVGTIAGFLLHKEIEAILQKPLGQTLYYSTPAGGLSFVMQIAVGVGFLAALPMLLYQFMQFTRPTIKHIKTRSVLGLILVSFLLALAAVVYVYFVSLPAALKFLVSFNSDSIQALINVNDYLRFIVAYIAGAIVAFQLPIFLIFMNKVRRFPPGGLTNLQRPVIVGSVIAAGVITPTVDPINQALLAGPIIILFQLGALSVWSTNHRWRKQSVPKPVRTPIIQQPQLQLEPVAVAVQVPKRRPMSMDIMLPSHSAQVHTRPIQAQPKAVKVENKPFIPKRPRPLVIDIMRPSLHNS